MYWKIKRKRVFCERLILIWLRFARNGKEVVQDEVSGIGVKARCISSSR